LLLPPRKYILPVGAGMVSLPKPRDYPDMSDDILSILARLEAGQNRLEFDIAKLRGDFLVELGSTRAAIMDRVERLENRVTEVRDDIAVAMGSSDQVKRANENTRADLRSMQEQVSVMWKQIKRLETRVDSIEGG
jgi:hypothetical protein